MTAEDAKTELAMIDEELTKLNAAFEEQRKLYKERVDKLNERRNALSVLTRHDLDVGQLVKAAAVLSEEKVGKPGGKK